MAICVRQKKATSIHRLEALPSRTSAPSEATALPSNQGVRRPNRDPEWSDKAPAIGLVSDAHREPMPMTRPSVDTFWSGAKAWTCSGMNTCRNAMNTLIIPIHGNSRTLSVRVGEWPATKGAGSFAVAVTCMRDPKWKESLIHSTLRRVA